MSFTQLPRPSIMAFALGFYMYVRMHLSRDAYHVTVESAQSRNHAKCTIPSPAFARGVWARDYMWCCNRRMAHRATHLDMVAGEVVLVEAGSHSDTTQEIDTMAEVEQIVEVAVEEAYCRQGIDL